MAAETITLEYTNSTSVVYSIQLCNFLDEEIPRRVVGEAALERTILGMNYSTGPSVKHKSIWTINALLENRVTGFATKGGASYNDVALLREMYDAWDTDRANGLTAQISITDEVLQLSSAYTANGWFTEPPVLSVVGDYGSKLINVSFSITEIP